MQKGQCPMIGVRLHSLLNLSTMWISTIPLFVYSSTLGVRVCLFLFALVLLAILYSAIRRRDGMQRLMLEQAIVVASVIVLHALTDIILYRLGLWSPLNSSLKLMGWMTLCSGIDLLYLKANRLNPASSTAQIYKRLRLGRHTVMIGGLVYIAIYFFVTRHLHYLYNNEVVYSVLPILFISIAWLVDYRTTTIRKICNLRALNDELPKPLVREHHFSSHLRVLIVRGQEVWYSFNKSAQKRLSIDTKRYESRKEAIERLLCKSPLPSHPKLLLRYFAKEPCGKRIVYLYVLNLPEQYEPQGWLIEGAFYPWSELYSMIEKQEGADNLKEELQYLKHTILLANSLSHPKKK